MIRLALVVSLAAACATTERPGGYEYEYTCRMVYACGDHGYYTAIPVTGTVDEVTDVAHEWTEACFALAAPQVPDTCTLALCAALCKPDAQAPAPNVDDVAGDAERDVPDTVTRIRVFTGNP